MSSPTATLKPNILAWEQNSGKRGMGGKLSYLSYRSVSGVGIQHCTRSLPSQSSLVGKTTKNNGGKGSSWGVQRTDQRSGKIIVLLAQDCGGGETG